MATTTETTDAPVAPPTGPHYYRSCASYEIPFRPTDPVALAETEGLRSFYAAYHDSAGRVVRFDKLRLVRMEKEPLDLKLPVAAEPGSALYFAVVPAPVGGAPGVGERIDYAETERLDEFFAGTVGPSGWTGKVTRFRKEIAFTDTYAYWPGGRLRTRAKSGPDHPPSVEYYDAEGQKVAAPAPYEWKRLLDSGAADAEAGNYDGSAGKV